MARTLDHARSGAALGSQYRRALLATVSSPTLGKVAFAVMLSPLLATGAAAQTGGPGLTPPAPTAQEATRPDGESGDIIVTAQKRAERLQDVPIAVTAVTATELANSGVDQLTQLNTLVPGLNIATAVGAFQPAIRGISTSNNVVENPTALYIDGVYLPNQREGIRDLADVEQVTVLKGPQGTLFGRNATAGVIQVTTRRPSHEPHAAFTLGYDNYETVKTSAYVTGGLTDTVAASVSASYATQGQGFGKSLTAGFDTYQLRHSLTLRGKLLFEPTAGTEITLIGDYLDREDSGANYQPYPGTKFSYPGFGPVTSRFDTYAGTPGYNSFKGGGVSLEVDQELGFAKLVSITSYRTGKGGFLFDFTNVAAPFIISQARVPNEDYTQELQLISPSGGRFQWVLGAFYFHNKLGYDPFPRTFFGPFAPLPVSTRQLSTTAFETTESVAPFAQVDYEIAPGTKLTLGGRLTYERRSIRGGDTVTRVNGTTATLTAVYPDLEVTKPTWRVALAHNFTPDVLVYASYNRGIKSGGFSIAVPNSPSYKPERLDDWEVGFKSQLFDRRLTFNANAFYYKYSNLQLVQFLSGAAAPIVTNAAKAELYGLDVDFRAQMTDELSLNGGFEALHSKFTSYPGAIISAPRPTGGVLLVPGNATGNRLPFAQNFVGTLALDYTKLIRGANTHFNVTGSYNGSYRFDPDNFLRQPSYVNLNSSFRIADGTDKLSLTFAVTNILNERVITRNITQAIAYFVNYGFPPRVYSVTAGFRF